MRLKSITTLPPVKTSISCCPLTSKSTHYLFRAVLDCNRCLICADASPDNCFTWGSVIMKFKIILMMDLFLFASQDVYWWTVMVWITCGLLWRFYQLLGLSFWRHPFTAEDPLVRKWCNATFLQNLMKKQTHTWPQLEDIFYKFSFCVNCSFKNDFDYVISLFSFSPETFSMESKQNI